MAASLWRRPSSWGDRDTRRYAWGFQWAEPEDRASKVCRALPEQIIREPLDAGTGIPYGERRLQLPILWGLSTPIESFCDQRLNIGGVSLFKHGQRQVFRSGASTLSHWRPRRATARSYKVQIILLGIL
jgi:hypothetical protein